MEATTTVHHNDDFPSSTTTVSWNGFLIATITVLITTLDDSIWLVSFVGTSSLPMSVRLVNAFTFLSSLMGLAILCCAVAVAIEQGLATTKTTLEAEELEHILEWIAVIFCWILAAGFYIKQQLKKKKKKKRRRQEQEENDRNLSEQGYSTTGSTYYGSLPQQEEEEELAPSAEDDASQRETSSQSGAQPCTIMSLTTLGFLDEISYFPALIVGRILSVWELLLGTLLAGMIMLGIQAFLASQCKPWIDFLDDHVKLHGIIAVFALGLTIKLILEYIMAG